MTWLDDITGYNLTAKDSINLGRIEGKTWAEVFGNLYVGNRERTKYLKYESLPDGKNELSFVGDVIRAAAAEAYFQGSFIAQGYIGVGSETKVESVLVGMTAEDAAVPSGVAASEGRIRFWAGKPFSERYDAPTKILENGKLISDEAEIRGTIYATAGIITNVKIVADLKDETGTVKGQFVIDGEAGKVYTGTEQNPTSVWEYSTDAAGTYAAITVGQMVPVGGGYASTFTRIAPTVVRVSDRGYIDGMTSYRFDRMQSIGGELGFSFRETYTTPNGSQNLSFQIRTDSVLRPSSATLQMIIAGLPRARTNDAIVGTFSPGQIFIDSAQESNGCYYLRIKG